jgi:hypothetical protein
VSSERRALHEPKPRKIPWHTEVPEPDRQIKVAKPKKRKRSHHCEYHDYDKSRLPSPRSYRLHLADKLKQKMKVERSMSPKLEAPINRDRYDYKGNKLPSPRTYRK